MARKVEFCHSYAYTSVRLSNSIVKNKFLILIHSQLTLARINVGTWNISEIFIIISLVEFHIILALRINF